MAEPVIEVVADVVETAGEDLLEVAAATRKFAFSPASFAIGLTVGAGISFFVTRQLYMKRFMAAADEEVAAVKQYYQQQAEVREQVYSADAVVTAVQKPGLEQVVEDLGYTRVLDIVIETAAEEETTKNVFTDQDYRGLSTDQWNYDRELQNRTLDKPYIIHKDEFAQGNFQGDEHEQVQFTYFIQDDVLCDEADQPVADLDSVIGLENLERFGHGSLDANVVYIRNDKLKLDFEILRDGGSYASTVHGVDDEIQHSAMRRQPRGFSDD